MAHSTEELELFKYDEVADASQVFSFEQALNDNWDKIDSFAGAIKSLSNLDAQGEKRFSDIWTELDKKLEAEVLLSENGYIKFNNSKVLLQWANTNIGGGSQTNYSYPIAFTSAAYSITYSVQFPNGQSSYNCAVCMSIVNKTQYFCGNSNTTFSGSLRIIVIGY